VRSLERPDGVQLYLRDFLVHSGTQAKALVVMVHAFGRQSEDLIKAADHFTSQGALLHAAHWMPLLFTGLPEMPGG
jgi:hypothetical protein